MPVSHTRRRARLRFARVTCFMVAAAIAVPFAGSSAILGREENPRQKGSGSVADALIVRLRAGVARTEMTDVLERAGATELSSMDDPRAVANVGSTASAASADTRPRMDPPAVHVVAVPAAQRNDARRALQADPRVASVEDDASADAAVNPSDPYWGLQWNARRVRAGEAWEVTRGDPGVIIAIVDTGVDGSHPDLRGRMVRGWDFHNNDSNPYDDDGHGTAVATTAAAAGNDRVGIAGMCWRCRIMPVKVLNDEGHGSHSNIAAGVMWAADHGADVINMSIAGLSSTTLLADAIAYAMRRGAVVVAAAGNSGTSRRTFPAAYPGVISVAATNNVDRLYGWSNRGSWVTLAAPGCSFSGRPRAKWAWICGTSLSTPIVAGTLGLMRSIAPSLSRARLTALLTGNTANIRVGTRNGRLDAAKAIRSVLPVTHTRPNPGPAPTPRPTTQPTPTPRPTGTPTPQARGSYGWRGTLAADDRWDREQFYLRGHVHMRVAWSGTDEVSLWVVSPAGDVIGHKKGTSLYAEFDLRAGEYTLTVQQEGNAQVTYKVEIDYGIVE